MQGLPAGYEDEFSDDDFDFGNGSYLNDYIGDVASNDWDVANNL